MTEIFFPHAWEERQIIDWLQAHDAFVILSLMLNGKMPIRSRYCLRRAA